MLGSETKFQSQTNRLLDLLEPADLDLLRPHLKRMPLEYRQPLIEQNHPISTVYFPLSGVASLVNTMANGTAAEVGTIGNEGMVGVPILFGDKLGPTSVYVQVPGETLHMPAAEFAKVLTGSYRIHVVMLHYAHALFNQVTQSAACNRLHHIEQRCCRWLLMTHDRVHTDKFLLTQEFLGMMLGVRRTSVTVAASGLKRKKLIDYSRGHVTILDREGLLKCSCECYAINKREFDRLLGEPHGTHLPRSASRDALAT
jgi:CRP-like cAMP-binding protein